MEKSDNVTPNAEDTKFFGERFGGKRRNIMIDSDGNDNNLHEVLGAGIVH